MDELESVFNSQDVYVKLDRMVETEGYPAEAEFRAYGKSFKNRYVLCIFVIRDGKARIFSAREDRDFEKERKKSGLP